MTGNDSTTAPTLARLGAALEQAARHDLQRQVHWPRRSRRFVLASAAVFVAVASGASFAAVELTSNQEVAASIPAGTLWLAGTEPVCTVVTQGVEFHCVLTNPPANAISDWQGTVEPTVDAGKHVNGGCRSETSDGLAWECYIGQTAVDQKIIGEGFLGQPAPTPGVG